MPGNVKASTDAMPPIDNYPHKKKVAICCFVRCGLWFLRKGSDEWQGARKQDNL